MSASADNRSGFIALMSAIVISVMLMAILVSLNLSGFFGRYNVLNSELKEQSFALASGCADTAYLSLIADPAYPGNETFTVASSTCTVLPIAPASGIIEAQGVYRNAYTNLRMTVNMGTMDIVSVEEVPVLP